MTSASKQATKSWSSTLRLPKSSFPPRASPSDLSTYLRRCTDDLYAWQRASRPATPAFTLHDGPPYANGDLHVGHALNKILKDIICRTKLAAGCRVDYTPGWDCHGLPIEIKALERLGWNHDQRQDALAVRNAARQFAGATVLKQMEAFRSWAVMGDWARHWKTMDKDFELRQLSVFRTLARDGLIYRKRKPVYWSPSSRTALAEAELEYNDDHVSTTAIVKFPISGPLAARYAEALYAPIWTTTPWTLPANQAIAVSRDINYCAALDAPGSIIVLAASRIPFIEKLTGRNLEVVDSNLSLESLLSSSYQVPRIFDTTRIDRPFIEADFVSDDSGTGLVHCAPGHGMEDYEALQPLIRQGRVAVAAPVDDEGEFTSEASPGDPSYLQGLQAFEEGNTRVLDLFQKNDLLLGTSQYTHKYPYDWRTKKPVMVRAMAQWFADVSSIKSIALKAIQNVTFIPPTGAARLSSFVQNRNEWCISRQRSWGVPIPALFQKETGEAVLCDESIAHIIRVIEERGIDAWWSDPADDAAWLPEGLSALEYQRGTDTMDVWFDSGTSWTHMETTDLKVTPQADVYVEGTDQHRGWFQSSLLTNVAYQRSTALETQITAPFRALLTHGFTLDGEGKKMSKSIGNIISPQAIISGDVGNKGEKPQSEPRKNSKSSASLGPDAIRLWVAGSDWTKDVVVSESIVKTVHAALHKLRVTFKLLLGALEGFDTADLTPFEHMPLADRLAIFQLRNVTTAVRNAFEKYEFHQGTAQITRWVNADFSGLYMESIKDTLYCDGAHNSRRKSAQTVLYHVHQQLQNMLAPIAPLLIEETWEHAPAALQKHDQHPLRRTWQPWDVPEMVCKTAERQLGVVMAINSAVKVAQERARNEKKMRSSLESDVTLRIDPLSLLDDLGIDKKELEEVLVVSNLHISDMSLAPEDSPPNAEEGAWVYFEDIHFAEQSVHGQVEIRGPSRQKCGRCWKYTVEASGLKNDHLCSRCGTVVEELKTGMA